MGANDYMYTGVQRDAAATVSKRQPYCVLINYVASSLFVYVATTLTILRRPIEACYVGGYPGPAVAEGPGVRTIFFETVLLSKQHCRAMLWYRT